MSEPRRSCRPVGTGTRFLQPVAAGRVVLREVRIEAGTRLPPHAHGAGFASLALAGHCLDEYRGRTRILASGVGILNSPGQEHRVRVGDAGFRGFEVVFHPAYWAAAGLRAPAADGRATEVEGVEYLLCRMYSEYIDFDEDSPLAIEALAFELAGLWTSGERPVDVRAPWITDVVEELNEVAPPTVGLAELARSHGVHPSHLARTFRTRFGCTVGEYVRYRRVARACRALAESEVSMGRLAFGLGFSDQAHFCRVFKRITGTTPGRFRRFARLD